jgi:hypothetical protein
MRAFISASSLITASFVSGAATEAGGLAAVAVAGAAVSAVGACAPAEALKVEPVLVDVGATNSLPGVLGFAFGPSTIGCSRSAIGITGELVAAFCCATTFIGVNPKQSNAVVEITILEFLAILPLGFTNGLSIQV